MTRVIEIQCPTNAEWIIVSWIVFFGIIIDVTIAGRTAIQQNVAGAVIIYGYIAFMAFIIANMLYGWISIKCKTPKVETA